jgi:uncharacterized protein
MVPARSRAFPFQVFLVLQLAGACGEEIGWRGFLQPILESRARKFAAVTITGVTWSFWHVQAFGSGLLVAACFLVSTLAIAFLLGYTSNGSFRQRVVVASAGRWLINVGLYLVVGDNTLDQSALIFSVTGAVTAASVVLLAGLLTKRTS